MGCDLQNAGEQSHLASIRGGVRRVNYAFGQAILPRWREAR
jgi:hypothetical protein